MDNKWEVLGLKNCTKVGEESLHVCADNRDGSEFSLFIEIMKVAKINEKTGSKACSFTRLGKLTADGYTPELEGIPRSKLVPLANGNFIVLIKRPEE